MPMKFLAQSLKKYCITQPSDANISGKIETQDKKSGTTNQFITVNDKNEGMIMITKHMFFLPT